MRVRAERDSVVTNLSDTRWYCIETNAHIVKLFQPSGSGTTPVFQATAITKFQGKVGETPSAGALNTRSENINKLFWIFDSSRRLLVTH